MTMLKPILTLLLAGTLTGAAANPAAALPAAVEQTRPACERPRPEQKPYVRWWWLGSAVDRAGLDYNLEEFARKGIGGVEITPIYGVRGNERNDLRFLSPAWMEAYDYTVRRAGELGLQVDMSNCTGWPFGGPWITSEQSACKYLLETRRIEGGGRIDGPLLPADPKQQAVAQLQAVGAVSDRGERIGLTERITAEGGLDWQAPAGDDWTLYALWAGRTFQKVKRAAPGGEGLVLDHYDRGAVEHYLARFDEAFAAAGAPWPDTFFNDSFEVYGASWTPALLEQFERDNGYRLEEYLPEFAAEGADDRSARIVSDYRRTLAGMLLRNFTQTWADWAHARGSRVRNQAHGSPGNIFDFYAAVDIPECESFGRTEFDIPGLRSDPDAKHSDADPAVLKFASSAAHVTGKRLISCETLTWLTEHFRTSPAQCKPEIDQILAAGVNHVYFHGAPYSPRGAAFPGWLFYASVNLSPTAPLWRDADGLFDYVARCQEFLQAGAPDNDFLLYIPMEEISHRRQGKNLLLFDIHKMDRTMPELKQAMNALVRGGYDADYISDRYLRGTRVRDGQIETQAGTRYRALVVPACRLIPLETIEHMLALARQGATVVFAECYPDDVPGFGRLAERRKRFGRLSRRLPAADFAQLTEHRFGRGRIVTGSDLSELLAAAGGVYEPLKAQGCQLIRRKDERGRRYFVALLDSRAIDGWTRIGAAARQVVLTDPLTGRRGAAAVRPAPDGTTELYLQLQPGQSLLIEARTEAQADTPEWPYAGAAGRPIRGRGWTLAFPEEADACEPGDTPDKPAATIPLAEPCSWTTLSPELKHFCGTGRYAATFTVADPAAAASWVLDLGTVWESARVRVNGREAGIAWSVPFSLEVGPYLRAGDNRIEIDVTNLPANRIAEMDRRGVEWRIFKDANIVSALNRPLDTAAWPTEPGGLGGEVKLIPRHAETIR